LGGCERGRSGRFGSSDRRGRPDSRRRWLGRRRGGNTTSDSSKTTDGKDDSSDSPRRTRPTILASTRTTRRRATKKSRPPTTTTTNPLPAAMAKTTATRSERNASGHACKLRLPRRLPTRSRRPVGRWKSAHGPIPRAPTPVQTGTHQREDFDHVPRSGIDHRHPNQQGHRTGLGSTRACAPAHPDRSVLERVDELDVDPRLRVLRGGPVGGGRKRGFNGKLHTKHRVIS
jgi:hypothetical protein